VRALDNVTFSVLAGEVHGFVGENGAGRSTLMAIAAGALVPEDGRVIIDGVEALGDPEKARSLGLAIVRQEPALMPDLTVAENLHLGVPEAEGVVRVTAIRSATSSFAGDDLPRKGTPLRQCGRASLLVDLPGNEMPLLIEMVVDLGVN
jgi:ABC-type sugar transport system ATPase subunit